MFSMRDNKDETQNRKGDREKVQQDAWGCPALQKDLQCPNMPEPGSFFCNEHLNSSKLEPGYEWVAANPSRASGEDYENTEGAGKQRI